MGLGGGIGSRRIPGGRGGEKKEGERGRRGGREAEESDKREDMSGHVLVTGGAGYLGSCLVPLLLDRGWKVTVFDTFSWGLTPLLPVAPRLRLIRGDVRDAAALRDALRGVDAVVHLAALVGYPACSRKPLLAEDVNVGGTKTLVAQLSPGQRLVFASTGSCYGAIGPAPCTEQTPLSPLSVYGRTKAEAEAVVLASGGVALRLATVFGVAPRLRLDLLLNDFTRRALEDGALDVYEPGFWRSMLHLVCDRTGSELHLGAQGYDEDRRNYRVSHDRIRNLGFKASISLEEGLDELLRILPLLAPHELEQATNAR
ncbi:hypothetical protein HPB48_002512 [Haemaphysalis longicornis]|uniref:NAD-dependent epimerase/dehydratase domain-containing protein n=1 Tax=Haemaphysalis longicornis TaxID=44386 RepID=A0A9J6G5N4_HAELO|nr:hypothetical protein HPB48_002512 [Haemaphysalis longicornis]